MAEKRKRGIKKMMFNLAKTAGKGVLRQYGIVGPGGASNALSDDLWEKLDEYTDKLLVKLEALLLRVLGQLLMDPDVAIRIKDIVAVGTAEGLMAAQEAEDDDEGDMEN